MCVSINNREYVLDTNNKYLLEIYSVNVCQGNKSLNWVQSTREEKNFV